MNETATFVRDNFAMHLDDTVDMYTGITFTVDTDIDTLNSNAFDDNSISTVPREEVSSTGACSVSLPRTLLDDLRSAGQLEANQTLSRFGYIVFSDDTFFQPRQGSESAMQFQSFKLGSVIVSATVAGIDRVENLSKPAQIRFQIRKVQPNL